MPSQAGQGSPSVQAAVLKSVDPTQTSGLPAPPTTSAASSGQTAEGAGNNFAAGGPEESKSACFPASGVVRLAGAENLRIRDVRTGDVLQTGFRKKSRVFLWTHGRDVSGNLRDAGLHRFVRVRTTTAGSLTASHGHLVYTCARAVGEGIIQSVVAIGQVRNGSHSLCAVRASGVDLAAVVAVEEVWAEGLFNPNTFDGDLVVDGFLCSCYTTAISGPVAHGLLAPLRALARLCAHFFQNSASD